MISICTTKHCFTRVKFETRHKKVRKHLDRKNVFLTDLAKAQIEQYN